MLKACSRCGHIHPYGQCPVAKARQWDKKITDAVRFRRTAEWQKKRREILERDRYLCKICLAKLYVYSAVTDNRSLQVHHIVPIEEDAERKLDDDNLISLCPFHHRMAEEGEIPRAELFALANIPPGEILNFLVKSARPKCSYSNTNFSPMGFWSEKNEK